MHIVRPLLKDSFLLAVVDGIGRGAMMLVLLLAARELTLDQYGRMSAVIALSLAITQVDLGVSTWLMRHLLLEKSESEKVQARAIEVSLTLSAFSLTTMTALAVIFLSSMEERTLALGVALYAGALGFGTILYVKDRAQRRLKRLLAGTLTEKFALVAIAAPAVLQGSLTLLGVAYLVAAVVRVLFNILTDRSGWDSMIRHLTFQPGRIWETFLESIPFGANGLAMSTIGRFDIVIVAAIAGPASAAFFALGDRVVALALSLSSVLTTAAMPVFGRRGSPTASDVGIIRWIAASLLIAFAAIVAIGYWAFPNIVPTVFGEQYREATPTVLLMSSAIPLSYATALLTPIVYLLSKERKYLIVTTLAACIGTGLVAVGSIDYDSLGGAFGFGMRQVALTIGVFLMTGFGAGMSGVILRKVST